VQFANGEQRIDNRGVLRSLVRSRKKLIVSAQRYWSDAIFDQTRVHQPHPVIQEHTELLLPFRKISQRHADRTF
jgi:hypothetical protein